jgi:hypothetical protein
MRRLGLVFVNGTLIHGAIGDPGAQFALQRPSNRPFSGDRSDLKSGGVEKRLHFTMPVLNRRAKRLLLPLRGRASCPCGLYRLPPPHLAPQRSILRQGTTLAVP